MTRTAFPSPYEMPAPAGAEGWERLYPYYMVFQPSGRAVDESRFWFQDSEHWPTVVKPFETVIIELAVHGLGQFNTRLFVVPLAYGVALRVHQGYVYLSPVAAPESRVPARVPQFQERAGYYYANWDRLLENWKGKVLGTIRELESISFSELPEVQPYEDIEAGTGLGAADALIGGYERLLALCQRAWSYHFEFLNLGYAAFLDFFHFCELRFPDIPGQAIAEMVTGVDMELFRPDDELRKLAGLAVALGVDAALTVPDPGEHTLTALSREPGGGDWLDAWNAARDPWFNFTSGNGLYSGDQYWRDTPSLPLGYIRDYILRLRRGETIDRPVAQLAAERERITAEYAALLDPPARADFDAKLGLARQVYPYVENHNFHIEHWTMGVFWRKARELSALLHRAGFWPGANDMFYLTRDEVRAALFDHASGWSIGVDPAGPGHWPPEVERRRRIMAALARQHPEPALNEPPRAITEPFSVMLWGITSERIRSWLAAPGGLGESGDLTGMAASPGVADGTARVIRSPDDLELLQEGDILVASITAPSWAPTFGKIRATVTDIGGIMSHAAIVCREYSLPAVTGTGSASTRIRTGQRIRVDGTAGTVTLLD
ncbi:PEP-utilizing enzyme [Streptomyces tubercidicus]|uniref:PEP-utilizing enzyme n=1 Tax=Streptomyces tubercidicus TaxID=47759 RepID=UPI003695B568